VKVSAVGALVGYLGLSLWLASRIVAALEGPRDLPIVLAALPVGVLAADMISGLVHWFCDTYFDEETPLLGPALIGPFRAHHRDPGAMTRRRLLDVNLSNWLGAIPILLAVLWAFPAVDTSAALFGAASGLFLAQSLAWTNQVHVWAHLDTPPLVARVLQTMRLAIAPEHHAQHHRTGSSAYCITVGWLNPLVDRLGFFERLERGVAAVASALASFGVGSHEIKGKIERRNGTR
jgi:ubiquitin-conjugating enzyme E2 variant